MSTWRKKAIECLPENKKEFENPLTTIYTVFCEMSAALNDAHIDNNNERIKKIYDFAAWCFRQKEKELWNAAGVSFYEHLADNKETFKQIQNWVSKEIYYEIRGLLELRISTGKLKELDKKYSGNTGK